MGMSALWFGPQAILANDYQDNDSDGTSTIHHHNTPPSSSR
jgi:hypothetical protein